MIREPLYYSNADDAPTHVADESVQTVGTICLDLADVIKRERKKFKKQNGDSIPASLDIEVDISMTMGSEKGVLSVSAKVGHAKVGTAVIQYDSMPSISGSS